MTNYTYTARDASGAMKKGSVPASDRTAALMALKVKGLIPLSVIEQGSAPQAQASSLGKKVPMLAGVAVLVIVATVALLMQPKEKVKAADVKHPEKRKVEPTAKKPVASTPNAAVSAAPKGQPARQEAPLQQEEPVLTVPEPAVAVAQPNTDNPPAIDDPGTNVPVRVFKTSTEQIISWIANSQMGNPPPPLPRLPPGDNIEAILNTDIILYDDDTQKIADAKYNVAQTKQMLKEYIAKGGKPDDFLAYYHTKLWDAHKEWKDSQLQLMELYKAGDAAGARKYAEEQSKVLQDKGIKPLFLPPALNQ